MPEQRTKEEMAAAHAAMRARFRRMVHSTNAYKNRYSDGMPCMVTGCTSMAVMRGMVNIWGTVCEVDLCEQHKDRDGKCVEAI